MATYSLDTPYSSQVVFLNSENCVSKNINGIGNYQYNFQTPIQLPTNCQMLISITDAQIPNIIPNVKSDNNRISFNIPAFSKFFTITLQDPDGEIDKVYSVFEWLAFVNEQIIIESANQFTLSGTYHPQSAKIKWFCNFEFKIIDTPNNRTTCIDLLGFKKNNQNQVVYESDEVLLSSIVSPAHHINMPSSVNFAGTRFIFIKFDALSVNNLNSNGLTDNSVVRVDNNAPYGHIIFYRPAEVHRFIIRKQTITGVSFNLTDTGGNLLNIFNSDAQITLKIEFMYKPEMRSHEEGTIAYELRKLSKVPTDKETIQGSYNPETNEFIRE
jgi:hypothetical protein